jgi:hypothetical protein
MIIMKTSPIFRALVLAGSNIVKAINEGDILYDHYACNDVDMYDDIFDYLHNERLFEAFKQLVQAASEVYFAKSWSRDVLQRAYATAVGLFAIDHDCAEMFLELLCAYLSDGRVPKELREIEAQIPQFIICWVRDNIPMS